MMSFIGTSQAMNGRWRLKKQKQELPSLTSGSNTKTSKVPVLPALLAAPKIVSTASPTVGLIDIASKLSLNKKTYPPAKV